MKFKILLKFGGMFFVTFPLIVIAELAPPMSLRMIDNGSGYDREIDNRSDNAANTIPTAFNAFEILKNTKKEDRATTSTLHEKGPIFTSKWYKAGTFQAQGFLKNGWPFAVDIEGKKDTIVYLEVAYDENIKYKPIVLHVFSKDERKKDIKISLPIFGNSTAKPIPAFYSIYALENSKEKKLSSVVVHGIAVGPKTVGSITVSEIILKPEKIHLSENEVAEYSYKAERNFNKISEEIVAKNEFKGNGNDEIIRTLITRSNVYEGDEYGNKWDGKKDNGKISVGKHMLQIRTWFNSDEDGWLGRPSYNFVWVYN